MTEVFRRSTRAAASRASVAGDELGRSLLSQVVALDAVAADLVRDDYRAAYESDPVAFYSQMHSGIDGLYQQMHAAATSAAVLVGDRAEPRLAVGSLRRLEAAAADARAHPLAAAMRADRRDLALLRWLLAVRNKAVQHRAENGFVGTRAIVLQMGFAECRKPEAPSNGAVRRARQFLRGLERTYDFALDPGTDARSAIVYLDLASYAFREPAPPDYDHGRYLVEQAEAYDLVISRDMLATADRALATLIGLAPENPNSPAAVS